MAIKLSDHFNYRKLVLFVLPSIGMMVFTSIYGVVDGYFVSNYAGKTPFAGLNLIMPYIMLFSAIGFMIGAGGTAFVSMLLGQKKPKEANEAFSLLVYFVIVLGIVLTIIGELSLKKVALFLGASEQLLPYCVLYGRITFISLTAFMLQNMFQSFLIAAEKPKLGFIVTLIAGITNMILDAVLVGALGFGLAGAAAATAISESLGGVIPLIYFFAPNSSLLHLGKTHFKFDTIFRTCTNGVSEFMSNISLSVVNMLYNHQLLKLAGDNGVAAYGVLMYVNFIFIAIFIGYSIGTAPIVGFNYGANNRKELKNVFGKSLRLIGAFAILMFLLAELLSPVMAKIFVGYDNTLMAITVNAFRIYSFAFLILGFNIYGSSFFTALNNGAISAAISFMRTFLFQVIMVLLLPVFFGINGVWASVIVAEVLSLGITIFFWIKNKKRYGY